MKGRFKQEFLARDYDKLVVRPGICDLLKRPYRGLQTGINFSSKGVRTAWKDPCSETVAETLSTPEGRFRLQLLADPEVEHLAFQHAWDPKETVRWAMRIGEKHPMIRGKFTIMTTDVVATVRSSAMPSFRAYNFKRECDLDERVAEKARIEAACCHARNIPFKLVVDTDLDADVIANMGLILGRMDPKSLPCDEVTKNNVLGLLTAFIPTGQFSLPAICRRADSMFDLEAGTALSVAFHGIAQRMWPIDLHQPLLCNRPIALI